MKRNRALITGITGQDGSYLTETLLDKGYDVFGLVRRSSLVQKTRIDHLKQINKPDRGQLELQYGDMSDGSSLRRLLFQVKPAEIYNLAAQSHVRISFDQAEYTADVDAVGALRLLEALRDYVESTGDQPRYYQAASSEMFGSSPPPQNEETPFHPCSPYAVSKVAAYWYTVNYREAYGLHCSNGILFNHESEKRGENFVTRKITRSAGRIKCGLQETLWLGNLDAKRDWGYAKDFVQAMWLMLQQERPSDYVIATGESHSVRDFLTMTFEHMDLDWQDFVRIDPYYVRPKEVDSLQGDYSKAREKLDWSPTVNFRELVKLMTEHDLDLAEREAYAMEFKSRR
jgi:GDPmannose 4,6-dehydratase